MIRKLLIPATISAFSLLATGARATVIYDGGAPNHTDSYYAEASYPVTEIAESFALAAGANTVGSVYWWGGCAGGTCLAADFTLAFYNDNGGIPGTLIGSYAAGNANQTATGNLIANLINEFAYSADIPGLTLTAGTTYWLGISNSTGRGVDGWVWELTSQGRGDGHASFLHRGTRTARTVQPDDLAFNLTDRITAIPEPASLALVGSSLLGFAVARRRKQTAS